MNPKALAVALTFAFTATILGQDSTPPKETPRSDAVRKLSRRERKEALSHLDERHRDFTADVAPIILPAELDLFLSLESASDRDTFVDEFWRRRDHHSRAHGKFRDVYYQRLNLAKKMFKQVSSDRAKMFLLHGPPDDVLRSTCARVQPLEIWKYVDLPGVGTNVRLLFYKPRNAADFRLWNAIGGTGALSDLFTSDAIAPPEQPMARRPGESRESVNAPFSNITRIQLECSDGNEIMMAVTQMIQSRVDLLKLFTPPELEAEDVRTIMSSVVIANPNAAKLTTEFSVRYPAKNGSRTGVQIMLLVPRAELSPAAVGESEVYTIDVSGEVLKDGQLWEKYRYRFDFPGDVQAEKLPIVIDRLLRPNEYLSRVKVTDANTGAEAVVEQLLDVPEIFEAEPIAELIAEEARPSRVPVGEAPTAPPVDAGETKEPRLRIVPPREDPVTGVQTIQTQIAGHGIKAVEFWMDGRKLAVRRSEPFALDFDFGEVPQMRRIRAIALDVRDKPLTGDELALNDGTDPFRIRIASPRFAPRLEGLTRVELDVSVPEGDQLEAVELYWNETRMATLFDEPFVQTVDIPKSEGPGYLRAVARLKDTGAPPVEDVVMVNTPAYMEELNVHLIELPTTVLIDGKPSDKLTDKAFRIMDEGKPVTIAKFDYVRDLPLSIGMAIDSSGSMQLRMAEAQKAGAQFFEKVMRKGDKAFVVAFDAEPRMMQKWSAKTSDVHAALARVRPEDRTALYDAIVYALYNFHGVRGQKALILISDGKDTASKFSYDQALEYARRTNVPVYAVGIGIGPRDVDVRAKLDRLCRETGGSTYYIQQARDLQKVYDEIQAELRSQYILGFYPSPDIKAGGKWRELTVESSEGKVKTVKGYFP
ncbi:MAG: Ca-activated chloride channel [Acidobacteriota bacterium]|nr:Ca-activated chloride channel [Acidobacteriota bacterium]